VFVVFRKQAHQAREIGRETFIARYTWVGNLPWAALPLWLYREIVRRHSRPGDIVVHLFSGSGNGGLAALGLFRRPVLIDLHYHREVKRRLKKSLRRFRRTHL
jgi:DNA modification methylase